MLFPLAPQRPSRSDLGLVAAYWLVVAPVLLLQYRADTGAGISQLLPLVGATVLFDTVTVALLVGGLLPLFLGGRHWLGLALLPLFLLLSGGFYFSLYGQRHGAAAAPGAVARSFRFVRECSAQPAPGVVRCHLLAREAKAARYFSILGLTQNRLSLRAKRSNRPRTIPERLVLGRLPRCARNDNRLLRKSYIYFLPHAPAYY